MSYSIGFEKFDDVWEEVKPLCCEHYKEMTDRLAGQGIIYAPYNPRVSEYSRANNGGWFLLIIVRFNGVIVGYCGLYITNDMHNQELIAKEDSLFITKNHRNGIGKKVVEFGLDDLRSRGVKRLLVSAMTDLKVAKLWASMGFKNAAECMIYEF